MCEKPFRVDLNALRSIEELQTELLFLTVGQIIFSFQCVLCYDKGTPMVHDKMVTLYIIRQGRRR